MAERLREQVAYEKGVFVPQRRASQPASPHYAGHWAGHHPEDTPSTTQGRPRRTLQPGEYDEEEDDALYAQRPPTSARRYLPPREEVYRQGHRQIVVHREPPPRKRTHWMLFVGIALCIMVAGWVAFGALASWWQGKLDDWTYGNPRTFQIDQYVGINDSPESPSHFMAMNLHGDVFIIDIEGGNPSKAQSIPVIGLSQGQQSDPVTISFQDVNGDGKPDMLVHVAGFTIVFLNNGKTFVGKH